MGNGTFWSRSSHGAVSPTLRLDAEVSQRFGNVGDRLASDAHGIAVAEVVTRNDGLGPGTQRANSRFRRDLEGVSGARLELATSTV
jgi:hypothetical protein